MKNLEEIRVLAFDVSETLETFSENNDGGRGSKIIYAPGQDVGYDVFSVVNGGTKTASLLIEAQQFGISIVLVTNNGESAIDNPRDRTLKLLKNYGVTISPRHYYGNKPGEGEKVSRLEQIVQEFKIQKSQLVFFDDSKRQANNATKANFKTVHVTDSNVLLNHLTAFVNAKKEKHASDAKFSTSTLVQDINPALTSGIFAIKQQPAPFKTVKSHLGNIIQQFYFDSKNCSHFSEFLHGLRVKNQRKGVLQITASIAAVNGNTRLSRQLQELFKMIRPNIFELCQNQQAGKQATLPENAPALMKEIEDLLKNIQEKLSLIALASGELNTDQDNHSLLANKGTQISELRSMFTPSETACSIM